MNDRSIFSVCTGSTLRCASDDWPVPKSSMPMRTPALGERGAAPRSRRRGRLDEHGLVDLEHEQRRVERGVAASAALDGRHELVVGQLAGREVHRDRERRSCPSDSRGPRARSARTLRAAPTRRSARSARSPRRPSRNSSGVEHPALRVLPAHAAPRCRSPRTGSKRDDAAGSARGTRRGRARAAAPTLDLAAAHSEFSRIGSSNTSTRPRPSFFAANIATSASRSSAFGRVVLAVRDARRRCSRRGTPRRSPSMNGSVEHGAHAVGERSARRPRRARRCRRPRARRRRGARAESPVRSTRSTRWATTANSSSPASQPEAVVDDLEVVEVEEHQPDPARRRARVRADERVGERLEEHDPVRELGERVVTHAVREQRLDPLVLGDVVHDAERGTARRSSRRAAARPRSSAPCDPCRATMSNDTGRLLASGAGERREVRHEHVGGEHLAQIAARARCRDRGRRARGSARSRARTRTPRRRRSRRRTRAAAMRRARRATSVLAGGSLGIVSGRRLARSRPPHAPMPAALR